MAEWLVVAGISLLIMATVGLVRRAASRGQSVLLFLLPLAGMQQVQENWQAYGWLALLRVLGFATALAALGLIYARQPALLEIPGQVLRGAKTTSTTSFVGSRRAALLMVQGEGQPLSGRVHGHMLGVPLRVSLTHGVLRFDMGKGFLPDLSVSILLGWNGDKIQARRSLLVSPADRSGPDVELSWRPPGHPYPETRIFHDGYRLQLALAPLEEHQLTGAIQLVMPDTLNSYLVGDFTVQTNNLRFLPNGKVNLDYDDPDTLAYVAEQYLQTQYPDGAIDHVTIENVTLHRSAGEGSVQARVTLNDGTVQRRVMVLRKDPAVGWAVAPDDGKAERLGSGNGGQGGPVASGGQVPGTAPKTRHLPHFDDLNRYADRTVTLVRDDGNRDHGRLERVSGGTLWLSLSVDNGTAEIQRAADDLKRVVLDDGTVITWGPLTPSAAAPPAGQADGDANTAGTGANPGAVAAPTGHGHATNGSPYATLTGRRVVVRLHNGETHRGVLLRVSDAQVTLMVSLGGGSMEYSCKRSDIASIDAATEPPSQP